MAAVCMCSVLLSAVVAMSPVAVQGADLLHAARARRSAYIEQERSTMLGSELALSAAETKANDLVMALKRYDLRDRSDNDSTRFRFDPAQHFFEWREAVKQSPLFRLIQSMPKGAVLHAHDTGLLGPDYVVRLTYMDHLYVCWEQDELQLMFARRPPAPAPAGSCARWQTMHEARHSSGDVQQFDRRLRAHFTIVTDNFRDTYTSEDAVWGVFQKYFTTSWPLLTYKPVWEQYFYDTLKTFRADNVMYLEVRSVLPPLYDLDGHQYDSLETARTYKRVLDNFMAQYPDFLGAKLIFAPMRNVSKKTLAEYLELAKKIKAEMPDFFAGFDIVGQESKGAPLLKFFEEFVSAAPDVDYFFHAGETNEWGTATDDNVADALALGSRRIGHGLSLLKHPALLQEVARRDIALEVCALSNHIGTLIADVRVHPLGALLARGLPVVLGSDDPGVWEAEPLSHDFYVAFVGIASERADLRLLKKLALNSLYYSAHSNKKKLFEEFSKRWNKFIDNVCKNKY